MGTKMGPSYAKLFVGFIEELIFEQYPGPINLNCLDATLTIVLVLHLGADLI